MKKMQGSLNGKKILILGTSAPQLDCIRYCQDLGLEVHACGHKRIGAGVEAADEFHIIDIKNKEEVAGYCKENDIDYVYSVGSEIAIPTANHVSKKLGLPYFIEPEDTDLAKDKTIWRDRLGSDFVGNIQYRGITNQDELSDWEIFPAMMKPADGQGQRGVRKVGNLKEVKAYYDEVIGYSSTDKMILEEYISGPELSVNAFVIDGDIVFLQESDRISFKEYPGGIPKEHRVPSKYSYRDIGLRDKLHSLIQEAVNKLSIDNGPVYIQLKLDDDLNAKFIEIAPRLDGCHLWRLIEYYSGANLLDASFMLLFGQKTKAKKALTEGDKDGEYILQFMMEKPMKTVNHDKYDTSGALFTDWYYEDGDEVREVNGFIEKVGYQIFSVNG